METRNTKQKPRETEEQEKFEILQEEELEESTRIEERSNNCKEDKLMQMLLEINSAMLNKFEENNQKFEEINKKLEENFLNKFKENNKKNWTKQELKLEQIRAWRKFKSYSKEIVDDVEEKTNIVNKTIMNYKEGEYRNFQEPQKGFMKNYWGIKEESVIKSELYGTKFNHSLRASRKEYVLNKIIFFKQLEEELLNKVRITGVKKFDDVVRILEIHYQCRKDGVRNDGNEYYNHYNNFEQRKYNYSGQRRNIHNYSQGPYNGTQWDTKIEIVDHVEET
ncbi:hypothetical protein FQA39_LY10594 [Lamprigera yunnana]|nr:hypothetical protein FQA39_LY10594 [Lamprigera yunnana]